MRRSVVGTGLMGRLLIASPALIPADARAQAATLRRIRVGAEVRLASRAGRFDGRLGLVTADSVTVQGEAGRRVLAIADVNGIWTRGNYSATGAQVGAAAAAALGVLFALQFRYFCEGCNHHGLPLAAGALAAGALAAVGAAAIGMPIGALIGLAIPRWVRRFP